jgi:hypothetical protein
VFFRSAAPDPCRGAIIWGCCPALGSGAAARTPQYAGCTNYTALSFCVCPGPRRLLSWTSGQSLPTRRALSGYPGRSLSVEEAGVFPVNNAFSHQPFPASS